WSRSLNRLVENIFDVESYFSSEEHNSNRGRNRQIRTFIEKSIDQDLQHHTDDEDEARKVYALLRDRFDRISWSRVMTLWGYLVNGSDAVEDPNSHYLAIHNTIKNLKLSLPGGFTEENLLAIVFHHRNQQCFHDIANALDGKLAVDRAAHISPKDVLEVSERVMKRLNSSNQINVMAAASSADR
ncbi:hypothetical protein O181_107306, partial [Austropuccinia psidii MF-1]|nr:hypothetical protein [Austropuccinia psidii MF-1]